MKVKVVIYHAEEGGYWAETPGFPGCNTEGETIEEIKRNIADILETMASIDKVDNDTGEPYQIHEIEV